MLKLKNECFTHQTTVSLSSQYVYIDIYHCISLSYTYINNPTLALISWLFGV